jgi:hypothetical protein
MPGLRTRGPLRNGSMKITFRTFADFREVIGAREQELVCGQFFLDIHDYLVLCFLHKKQYLIKQNKKLDSLCLG